MCNVFMISYLSVSLYLYSRLGLEVAYDLLNGKTRTGCQSIIIFVTDGKDTDGEPVRCGPGKRDELVNFL